MQVVAAASPRELGAFAEVIPLESEYLSWTAEAEILEVAQSLRARSIVGSSEDDVLRLARVRERLGLPGQSVKSALAYRDKWTMHCYVSDAGIKTPRTALLSGAVDLIDAYRSWGSDRVVVKPRSGVGSDGLVLIDSHDDLAQALASGLLPAAPRGSEPRLLAQTYVDGDFYHVDGVMSRGRVLTARASRYSSGLCHLRYPGSVLRFMLQSATTPETAALVALTRKVISALPAPATMSVFHLEAWLTDGEATFCEVASRPSGGPAIAMLEAATGIHLSKVNYQGQAGIPISLGQTPRTPGRHFGSFLISPGEGRIIPPRTAPPGTPLWHEVRSDDKVHRGPEYVGDAAFQAVYAANDPKTLDDQIDTAVRWWQEAAQWRKSA